MVGYLWDESPTRVPFNGWVPFPQLRQVFNRQQAHNDCSPTPGGLIMFDKGKAAKGIEAAIILQRYVDEKIANN